ncbi:ThiF family adenylyltransferase [Microbispora sp. ATCC PTA-5024]|uniref:ThiF family adenylyltransferase n=1 Tax=Microbispora sp. ATCC PTA-5024 TaxID=316330 RepID=UPI000567156D|nr:ThiF family adenylyltransferase [Microbispora sp. ATCC PTA-5024]
MRPRVKPALRRVERDDRTLQFGVHPLRAVVLTDVEPPVRRLIDGLDGTRTLRQAAAEGGLDEGSAREVVDRLAERGLIEDAAVRPHALSGLTVAERDRLRPDLARLSLTSRDGGMQAMAARRAGRVRIYGAGRVGAQVAALFAAAGVGHVCVVDPGAARPEDLAPGGLGRAALGGSREDAAVALLREIAPGITAWPGRSASRLGDRATGPDLVVLAPVGPLDPVLVRDLVTGGVPHLLAAAFEGHGCAGPLVVPGVTPCLRCLDLVRRDRDPSWPAVVARLGGYPPGEIACDVALASLVAAQAAAHALDYLDRGEVPGSTWDVVPGWHWRRRTWQPHPECDCRAGLAPAPESEAA